MDLVSRIAEVASAAAAKVDLIVDAVELNTKSQPTQVVINLDLPEELTGSADIDVVAQAANEISIALDAFADLPAPYLLEVGTPGAERKLHLPRHFRRARNRLVKFRLHSGAEFSDRIGEVSADAKILLESGKQLDISEIAHAQVQLEFKRPKSAQVTGDGTS